MDEDQGNYGSHLIISALVARGYTNMMPDVENILPRTESDSRKTFVFLSSTTGFRDLFKKKQSNKKTLTENVRNAFNDPGNNHGQHIRFMVLGKKFKEGLDLFDVKYAHLLDSMPPSQEKQAMGRGTRNCGQKNLRFKPNVGWQLQVYRYLERAPAALVEANDWPSDKFEDVIKSYDKGAELASFLMNSFEQIAELSSIHRAIALGEATQIVHEDDPRLKKYNVWKQKQDDAAAERVRLKMEANKKEELPEEVKIEVPLEEVALLVKGKLDDN
jgi:hypothetical protein